MFARAGIGEGHVRGRRYCGTSLILRSKEVFLDKKSHRKVIFPKSSLHGSVKKRNFAT